MATDAQKKATARYVAQNVKKMNIGFFPKDRDVYDWLSTKESRPAYVREVLREKMEQEIANGLYSPEN